MNGSVKMQIKKPVTDSEMDVTDQWIEADGDDDAEVAALFDHDTAEFYNSAEGCFHGERANMVAIAITQDDETRYYGRDDALVMLGGWQVVEKMEQWRTEALNGF